MCVILNFKTMEIVDIIDGRTKRAWSSYTQIIDKKELAKGQSFLTALYKWKPEIFKASFLLTPPF